MSQVAYPQWIGVPVSNWGGWHFPIIEPQPIEKKTDSGTDGCCCAKCQELFPQAELPEDGSPFVCWACRNGY